MDFGEGLEVMFGRLSKGRDAVYQEGGWTVVLIEAMPRFPKAGANVLVEDRGPLARQGLTPRMCSIVYSWKGLRSSLALLAMQNIIWFVVLGEEP